MNGNDRILGLVQDGQFQPLALELETAGRVRLTSIPIQAAQSPESGQLDLAEYEGSAIMVRGHSSGGWIYSAQVIDHAGPILTAVVGTVFRQESGTYSNS